MSARPRQADRLDEALGQPDGRRGGQRGRIAGDEHLRIAGVDRARRGRAAALAGIEDRAPAAWIRRLGHSGPGSSCGSTIWAAIRMAPSDTMSRWGASIASASRSISVRARGVEPTVEQLDPVLPGVDRHGLGLGGHVDPELRAAPLGQQLDAQGRPGGHPPTGPVA